MEGRRRGYGRTLGRRDVDLWRKIAGLLVIAVALVIVAAGCGGGSDTDDGAADASGGEAGTTKTSEVEARQPDEPEASKTFLKPGTKNKIAEFGEEASAKEREAASAVLEENFEAREAGEWAKQCASLTESAIKNVKEIASTQGGEGGGGCAKALGFRAKPLKLTKGLRENTLTGPIDALRFKGAKAYALYHGAGGRDYQMPMEKVDGEWKVDDLLTREL
jgi:hypothetical protein